MRTRLFIATLVLIAGNVFLTPPSFATERPCEKEAIAAVKAIVKISMGKKQKFTTETFEHRTLGGGSFAVDVTAVMAGFGRYSRNMYEVILKQNGLVAGTCAIISLKD